MNKILSLLTLIIISLFSYSKLPVKAVSKYAVDISFTLSKTSATPGDTFSITLKAKNTDSVAFTLLGVSVDMNDYIPANNIKVNCIVSSTCDGLNWNQTFTNIAPGETKTVTGNFKVDPTATIGTKVGPGTIMAEMKAAGDVTTDKQNSISNPTIRNWTISVVDQVVASPTPMPTKVAATSKPTPTPTKPTTATAIPTPTFITPVLPQIFLQEGSLSTKMEAIKSKDELSTLTNFTLDIPGKNMVEFEPSINLTEIISGQLEKSINLLEIGKVSIDSEVTPEFNIPAKITMRNLSFETEPLILRNGLDASDYVSNINYDKDLKTLVFNVKGFSTYEAVERPAAIESEAINSTPTNFSRGKFVVIGMSLMLIILFSTFGFIYRYKKMKAKAVSIQ